MTVRSLRCLKMSDDVMDMTICNTFSGSDDETVARRKIIFIRMLAWFCEGLYRYMYNAIDITHGPAGFSDDIRFDDIESVWRACIKAGILRDGGEGRMDAYEWLMENDLIDYGEEGEE